MTTIDHLDPQALLELSRRTDSAGVLSVYVDADPSAPPNLEGAGIELRNRLRDLERLLDESQLPRRTLVAALERLQPRLDALVSAQAEGRARVLFAAVGADWTVHVASQLPVHNRVVLDEGPFIHPLLELLDEGRAAGVVVLSGDEARLFDWRMGELRALGERDRPHVEAPHERSGPIGRGPTGGYSSPVREQQQARERELAARFLQEVAEQVVRLAEEHRWERLVVSGGERWTPQLVQELPDQLRGRVVSDTRVLTGRTDREIAVAVTERLHQVHTESESEVLQQVRDAAGAGTGALGASQVVAALNAGQVAHLVYDPQVRYRGAVGPEGVLYAGDETVSAAGTVVPEPRLTERLVERALETGARVSPIEGAAAGALADVAGIGALLRW